MVDAGDYHVELVTKDGIVEVYVSDHDDKPIAIAGYKGIAILSVGGKSQRIVLEASDDRLTGKAAGALPAQPKGVVQITPPAGKTVSGEVLTSAASLRLRPVAIRWRRRARHQRHMRVGHEPRLVHGLAHQCGRDAHRPVEMRAILVDADGARDHCAHRHQPIRRNDNLERFEVVGVVSERRPDRAPLFGFQRIARGHHLAERAEGNHVVGVELACAPEIDPADQRSPMREKFSNRATILVRDRQTLHDAGSLRQGGVTITIASADVHREYRRRAV